MLYKIKDKFNNPIFVIIGGFALIFLTLGMMLAFTLLIDKPQSTYHEAYYFLKNGIYVIVCMFIIVDIMLSFVRLLIIEKSFVKAVKKLEVLIVVLLVAIVILTMSIETAKRFFQVLCDVPNIINDNTCAVETNELEFGCIDEHISTTKSDAHRRHYYVMIDGEEYLVSNRLVNKEAMRVMKDYKKDDKNRRPRELDEGTYSITYLPKSRSIICIEFEAKEDE